MKGTGSTEVTRLSQCPCSDADHILLANLGWKFWVWNKKLLEQKVGLGCCIGHVWSVCCQNKFCLLCSNQHIHGLCSCPNHRGSTVLPHKSGLTSCLRGSLTERKVNWTIRFFPLKIKVQKPSPEGNRIEGPLQWRRATLRAEPWTEELLSAVKNSNLGARQLL